MEGYKSSTAGLRLDNESELEITVALNTQDAFRGVTWWWPRLAGKQSIPSGHCIHCYAGCFNKTLSCLPLTTGYARFTCRGAMGRTWAQQTSQVW